LSWRARGEVGEASEGLKNLGGQNGGGAAREEYEGRWDSREDSRKGRGIGDFEKLPFKSSQGESFSSATRNACARGGKITRVWREPRRR